MTALSSFSIVVSIAIKTQHDHDNSYKGKTLGELAYTFRGLDNYLQCGNHVRVQEDMELEKKI